MSWWQWLLAYLAASAALTVLLCRVCDIGAKADEAEGHNG